jgi:hypothetical protein
MIAFALSTASVFSAEVKPIEITFIIEKFSDEMM